MKNQYNKVFVKKMYTMSVRQLEHEIRACEYQMHRFTLKRNTYSWDHDDRDGHVHSFKVRQAMAKCMPMWSERLLLIEKYMPMAQLMEG